jgi:hypothetical protein
MGRLVHQTLKSYASKVLLAYLYDNRIENQYSVQFEYIKEG